MSLLTKISNVIILVFLVYITKDVSEVSCSGHGESSSSILQHREEFDTSENKGKEKIIKKLSDEQMKDLREKVHNGLKNLNYTYGLDPTVIKTTKELENELNLIDENTVKMEIKLNTLNVLYDNITTIDINKIKELEEAKTILNFAIKKLNSLSEEVKVVWNNFIAKVNLGYIIGAVSIVSTVGYICFTQGINPIAKIIDVVKLISSKLVILFFKKAAKETAKAAVKETTKEVVKNVLENNSDKLTGAAVGASGVIVAKSILEGAKIFKKVVRR